MKVELKAVKIHDDISDETVCFSANIYVDGKKIASVSNQGCGGSHMYYPTDQAKFKELEEFCKAQPHEYEFEITDQYVDKLLAEYEERRWLKRRCKSRTLFRLSGDKDGSWRTVKGVFSEDVVRYIRTKYGDKVARIANQELATSSK